MTRIAIRTPPKWVSYWFSLATPIVLWDAAYCFYRPRSMVGGDLSWIWWPYNSVPYGEIDWIYGTHALDAGDGFTNAQSLLNVIEAVLQIEYLYLRHNSPRAASRHTTAADKRPRYHAHAPLVGFAASMMTLSKTVLYFLQEYFCGWCMVGHNTRSRFWLLWVLPNVSRALDIVFMLIIARRVPFIVCVILGRFVSQTLNKAYADEIVYKEWADLQSPIEEKTGRAPTVSVQDGIANGHSSQLSMKPSPLTPKTYLPIRGGAGLPLTFTPRHMPVLVLGAGRQAANRAYALLEADADVIVSTSLPVQEVKDELEHRLKRGELRYIQLQHHDLLSWAKWLSENDIALVCVTDTLIGSSRRSFHQASVISKACKSLHIPVNISDQPSLSSFSFPSVHRFAGVDGLPSQLQVAVSTNGHGCRLTGRIRREIASKLPANIGAAVDTVGRLRQQAKDNSSLHKGHIFEDNRDLPLNSPVLQLGTPPISRRASQVSPPQAELSQEEQQLRRMRWVQQMSEYYPYDTLAKLTEQDMAKALDTYPGGFLPHHEAESYAAAVKKNRGHIYLVGSGPGHPSLLTVAAHHVLTHATLILSDKLVPAEVLALIPPKTEVHIAKKFPGNAEGAQNEMMELALVGAQKGETVVRLKQGDPFVYGRGGEEVLFFREHGFECTVIPGVSSALAGPLMVSMPVTQRGVAESMILCTGVGRQGKSVQLPGYIRSRSLVVLMGVARIAFIIEVLTSSSHAGRDGDVFPIHTPIALIERASSPDQRVVSSTLENIEEAIKSVEERPPGMMLIGWSVLALEGKGRVDVLDVGEEGEGAIVREWLGKDRWKVREGLSEEWTELIGQI